MNIRIHIYIYIYIYILNRYIIVQFSFFPLLLIILPNPSRETKSSGANADREMFIFPVQLTTCRVGNLTRLIHTLVICATIHTYGIYIYILSVYHFIVQFSLTTTLFIFSRNALGAIRSHTSCPRRPLMKWLNYQIINVLMVCM